MGTAQCLAELRADINLTFLSAEADSLAELRNLLLDYDARQITQSAQQLVAKVRGSNIGTAPILAFLHEYGLHSAEGIAVLNIAEALLRIPDRRTRQEFLREQLADAGWYSHHQHSPRLLINLTTLGLTLAGKMSAQILQGGSALTPRLLSQLTEPLLGIVMEQILQQLATGFVIAENIGTAVQRSLTASSGYRYSFDMLGEAAITSADADHYYQAYAQAIQTLAKVATDADLMSNPGISIKLSALYPRYEALQYRTAGPELCAKLSSLALQAKAANISLTVDAEEAGRLQLSLDIFAQVSSSPELAGWPGLGLAVQAYHKSALAVIRWLAALAAAQGRRIPLRLVKGAYWDTEIKRAQENGWNDYPVFTSKAATDVSYLACARTILADPQVFYPQFATHNAHTVAAICEFGRDHPGFEFQRLYGMGEALYQQLSGAIPCRVYAPVGGHRELLPYLVRRLLENGSNNSFINQLENPALAAEVLCRDPLAELPANQKRAIAAPPQLFGKQRRNSHGLNLTDPELISQLQQMLDNLAFRHWSAAPLLSGRQPAGVAQPVYCPYQQNQIVGSVINSKAVDAEQALSAAWQAYPNWRLTAVAARAGYLQRAADMLEARHLELIALCIREGGRTLPDALAEVREAVDYCRYYAVNAMQLFSEPQILPGPVGETNQLGYFGRGVFVCISPWNFPAAIFIGQIVAALVAGNTVIAKPAAQTALTAMFCVQLLHEAGVPVQVLHLLPGDGPSLGRILLNDVRIAGVAFTGSTTTAHVINQQLAARESAIGVLIAETGGQNVLIADTSAHQEQLIADVLQSAFNSAGQRCSALRVLFLPEQSAEPIIARLIAAMQLLRVGAPTDIGVDIGPLIDRQAVAKLHKHVEQLCSRAKQIFQIDLADELQQGCFFAPTLLQIDNLALLNSEVFGPVLHVITYGSGQLPQVIATINASAYGLTLGVHTRLQTVSRYVQQHAQVGNVYINRNMIGAVVGVQPFGGMGLSGTGPKAGGPDYLRRFAVEQTVSTNIAAIGANPGLFDNFQVT
ncbi:bifunctional proline dehydrogenase/L-glutamate gamma-semialdehyde dehydrogenase PutA [Methylomonas paludis]|uniref:Bifunctional protein PutA n=1 Tax=Methylomonas paludis TaxID=1173101 RepID=A0A975MKQ2_9GAMM|nr:bifunctional proline dehydrogenase/L-glutamate gamma-semialdehyde dehydrogenase PutA [Methylomonas paludis]QWF69601.1 bifunctional proline dehydrogenase/L-glutamate gamma-semialdehyde dehydrogenase PutA [Methylomonas paludis]